MEEKLFFELLFRRINCNQQFFRKFDLKNDIYYIYIPIYLPFYQNNTYILASRGYRHMNVMMSRLRLGQGYNVREDDQNTGNIPVVLVCLLYS